LRRPAVFFSQSVAACSHRSRSWPDGRNWPHATSDLTPPYRRSLLDINHCALAGTHKRLDELYEAKGEREKAASHYQQFVDLWKNADPEFQPRIAEVKTPACATGRYREALTLRRNGSGHGLVHCCAQSEERLTAEHIQLPTTL
jgi:hypothetical protein